MAEEEVSYATVKFKKKKHSTKVKKEETVYDEVEVKMSKGANEAKEQTPDTNENQELEKKNEELETEKKHLTEQIQQMTTPWIELNVSRAQWSIDAYCPKDKNNGKCNACQAHWDHVESSCYAVNNAKPAEWKTWEEARKNCRGKSSDLAVVVNEEEKETVSEKSWKDNENKVYWIGLRVEDGKWKWLDGRDAANSSWINQPPSDGHCAISVQHEGFKSVSCDEKNAWICKKKALSV
uniref:C-type lectin domain-containing protein n=1 Tax=Astatotilapia calliptera TaxID=8154 RepID=A0AAX7T559_ASTCA